MEIAFRYAAPPSPCGYLPDRLWSLEYEWVESMTRGEYMERMKAGWRRFGYSVFHPACPQCRACRSIRVIAGQFRPSRSQRRARRANEEGTQLRIGGPSVSRAKLDLYRAYHAYQAERKGWPEERLHSADSYREAFVHHPFPTEEWCYYREGRLVGVGYVDALDEGLSAIYFFYDPAMRSLSLGVWNVLQVIEQTALRGLPHAYLGYYVEGSASMAYKADFNPHQLLDERGEWE